MLSETSTYSIVSVLNVYECLTDDNVSQDN